MDQLYFTSLLMHLTSRDETFVAAECVCMHVHTYIHVIYTLHLDLGNQISL